VEPLSAQIVSNLIEQAKQSREKGYAPYSGFPVGAALLGKSGSIYTGCNVENASFSATRCAEQTAVLKGVGAGEKEFTALAVVADTEDVCRPCGICRQILSEFAADMWIIMANLQGKYEISTLKRLYPLGFSRHSLKLGTNLGDKK
jgi:homotetrameric cytidine deaminase